VGYSTHIPQCAHTLSHAVHACISHASSMHACTVQPPDTKYSDGIVLQALHYFAEHNLFRAPPAAALVCPRELHKRVSAFMLRRTQEVLSKHLPPLAVHTMFCRPSALQVSGCEGGWAPPPPPPPPRAW
jgi:hypothetical protein